MFELSFGATIELLAVVGLGVFASWIGYKRRRTFWSRSSWMGFCLTVLSGVAMLGFMLAFSIAVDRHAAWVGTAGSSTRVAWIVAAVGGLVGGSLLTAGSLAWFARGEPSRPFSLAGLFEQARIHLSSDERKQLVDGTRTHEDA